MNNRKRAAFTLIEALTATVVALYVFAGAWAIFTMTWRWWHETSPVIEAERVARTALLAIVDGAADPTAGAVTIGPAAYGRRNGIAWAVSYDIPAPQGGARIDYALAQDGAGSNIRSFYMAADGTSGLNAVYYKDSGAAVHMIGATLGITDLKFEQLAEDYDGDSVVTVHDDIIKVTATVDRLISGTRGTPYPVKIVYNDVVYLGNAAAGGE